jgi:hypothetical protein
MGRGILLYSSEYIIDLSFSGVKPMSRFILSSPKLYIPFLENSFVWVRPALRRNVMISALLGILTAIQVLPCLAQTTTNPNVDAQLLVAARKNNLDGVRQALARGAEANSRNRLGKTALIKRLWIESRRSWRQVMSAMQKLLHYYLGRGLTQGRWIA